LLRELAADPTEELLAVDASRGDLLTRRFHHSSGLLVEGSFLLDFVGERGEDRGPEGARHQFLEKLAAREAPGSADRDELLARVGE